MTVPTFLLERTDKVKIYLRRYGGDPNPGPGSDVGCRGKYGYHDAQNYIATEKARYEERGTAENPYTVIVNDGSNFKKKYPRTHKKWPTICDWCGYEFKPSDEWQFFTEIVYRRADTGEEMGLRNAPDGAMWWAWWYKDNPRYQPNGALMVKCPGGSDWNIDGRATNCTMPKDDEHRCWIRHGDPPRITVDKNGLTCSAGGGSIIAGNYHGFLRDGVFTDNL